MLSKHISFIYYVAFLGSTVFLFSKHLKDEISNQKDQVYNIASNIPPFQKELSKNHIGVNIFLREIVSGTCASHRFKSILSLEACAQAAKKYGHTIQKTFVLGSNDHRHQSESCSIASRFNLPYQFSSIPIANDKILKFGKISSIGATRPQYECSANNPCFCTTDSYIHSNHHFIQRETTKVDGQFKVTWNLNLGGRESLLESDFLRAGFEQSVKDYINNDILCSDDLSVKGAEFFGVSIDAKSDGEIGKKIAISGNGLCKGDIRRCEKPIQLKRKIKNAEENSFNRKISKATQNKESFCDVFLSSTIFDSFEERLLTASTFNYDVDVSTINDLEGNLDLTYEVKFESADGSGLDQIDDVSLDPDEPLEINPQCSASQCAIQRDVIRGIFEYFGVAFDENKHECLNQGINCNSEDLVSHIWMVNFGFPGKTIPSSFGSLHSLVGLFLGGNNLVGSIPPELSRIRNLEMLWLENNMLTGSIPSEIANLRGLLELNLYQNKLGGPIPERIAKLQKLRVLNLGSNELTSKIPTFIIPSTPKTPDSDCVSFVNPFKKIFRNVDLNSIFFLKDEDQMNYLVHLKTLSLSKNRFTGTIPSELHLMHNLEELNIAENNLTGTVPLENLKDLVKLKTLDLHKNSLKGALSSGVGRLIELEILNLHGNKLSSTLPVEISRLFKLKELVLDDNLLTGPIPTELGYLLRLNFLTFGGNIMSGTIPTELGELQGLENLDLRNYTVLVDDEAKREIGTIPTELGQLTFWKHVVLINTTVTGSIPIQFGNISSAETLWLKNSGFSGTIPVELSKLESLSIFSLGNNNINGSIPPDLANLLELETLDLGDNSLSGTIPPELRNLSSLEFIQLGANPIAGRIPRELQDLDSLQFLLLSDMNLTGEIPSELGTIEDLALLSLYGNVLEHTIPSQLGRLQYLQKIDFANNSLTGSIPSELASLIELTSFNLAGNSLHASIPSELGNLVNLELLNLRNNKFDSQIPSELGSIQTLQIIDLGMNDLTFTIPTQIAHIVELEYLDISFNDLTGRVPSFLEDRVGNASVIFISDGTYVIPYPSTFVPSLFPSNSPQPSHFPTVLSSHFPTTLPSILPSSYPSILPTIIPSNFPSIFIPDGIYPPDPEDNQRFGFSVDISSTVMVVGAPYDSGIDSITGAGITNVGKAYIFSTSGSHLHTLSNRDPAQNDYYGRQSRCSDTHVVVGNWLDDDIGAATGSADFYLVDGTFVTKVVPTDLVQNDGFGYAIGMDNSKVAISAKDTSDGGRVYLFNNLGIQANSFKGSDTVTGDTFGYSIDLADGILVVGAPNKSSFTGAVYIFDDNGTQLHKFVAPDATAGYYFGYDVAVSNGKIVVGSYKDSENGLEAGAAHIFLVDGTYVTKLVSPTPNAGDRFGSSVSISDAQDLILVGAPKDGHYGSDSGAAYYFQTDGTYVSRLSGKVAGQLFGRSVAVSDAAVAAIGAIGDSTFNSGFAGTVYLM